MIFVSSHISKEELLDLKNDLSILFPKYTLTDIETSDIKFQVVSNQEYPMIPESNVPILTPISVHQMIDKKINTNRFTLPQHGFMNLHLFQRKISFSGFGSSKQKLIDMSYRMGAIVERRVSSKTTLLVSKTLRSNKAQAALKFGIPVVQDTFIYELFQSPFPLDESNYFLKLFSGLVFTCSSLKNRKEKESIIKYIVDNGGTFQGGLYSKTSFVISKPNSISIKLKEALDMKKTIIVDDLKDFYPNPQSLKKDTFPLLLPSELFTNLSFYISPKLENLYQNIFTEFKILIQQHSGNIVNSVESANYIIQMDTEKDNRIESQNHGDKRKISTNESSSSISNPTYSSMSNNTPRMIPRTPIWVERCVEEGRILPSSDFYLFTPTKLSKRSGNFYVSLTGFDGQDYLNLISTLKWLDIRYSTRFKKSMTHLIAKNSHSSKKTKAATEWDIPIVGVDWLFSIAEGNLTSEALSNPWSPKRSQKVGPVISTSKKNTINLDISDDDLDIEIIDQKTVNSTQSSSNGKNNNQKGKLNSPLLKSGSSSQRLQSPIRIPPVQTDSKNANINAKSQSKPTINFLDDDDDDFPEFLYEDIIAHKVTPKTAPSDRDIIISNNNAENKTLENKILANSFSIVNSPRKSKSQSQASPKPVRLNQPNKNSINFLSSDDDESLDILYEISQKNTAPLSRNQSGNDVSNSTKVDTNPNLQPTNSFNGFQSNSTDIKNDSKPFLQKKIESNSNITAPITPINSINIERSKSDKLITPPSVIDHHNPKNNQSQNLFELSMRRPSPPPQPSIHQIQRQSNDLNAKGIMKTEIKIPPAQPINQKTVTIITDESHNVQQQPKQDKKPVLKFLDDDDDDDDICDFTEYEKPKKKTPNTADATSFIMKMVNRKRKVKKNNNSKSNNNSNVEGNSDISHSNDEDNTDSQYDLLESFTQKPVDNDDDVMPIISYEDTDEPSKDTVVTDDDEDPLLKLLQTKKSNI